MQRLNLTMYKIKNVSFKKSPFKAFKIIHNIFTLKYLKICKIQFI